MEKSFNSSIKIASFTWMIDPPQESVSYCTFRLITFGKILLHPNGNYTDD